MGNELEHEQTTGLKLNHYRGNQRFRGGIFFPHREKSGQKSRKTAIQIRRGLAKTGLNPERGKTGRSRKGILNPEESG